MYWWKTSALAEDFREGRVDEKERFKYFLATFVTGIIVVQLLIYSGSTFRIEDLAYAACNLAAGAIGIALCYRANKKGDNTDFIARMICLGWPVGIQLAVMFSALFLLFGVIESRPSAALDPESYRFALAHKVRDVWVRYLGSGWFWIGVIVPYYLTIYGHLVGVSRARAGKSVLQEKKTEWSAARVALGIFGGIVMTIALVFTMIHVNSLGLPEPLNILVGLALPLGLICLLVHQLDKWLFSRK